MQSKTSDLLFALDLELVSAIEVARKHAAHLDAIERRLGMTQSERAAVAPERDARPEERGDG